MPSLPYAFFLLRPSFFSFLLHHSALPLHLPHSSFIIHHSSFIIPPTLHLPHSSFLIHPSSFRPPPIPSSFLIHPSSFLRPHSSFLLPHSSFLLPLGMILLLFGALATVFSIQLLIRARNQSQLFSYEDLTVTLFGKAMGIIVELNIIVFCFGTSVAYVVRAGPIILYPLYTFIAVFTPIYTRYTRMYTIYTP